MRKVGHSEALKRLQPLELVIPKAGSYHWCLRFSVHPPLKAKRSITQSFPGKHPMILILSQAVLSRNSETRSVGHQRRLTLVVL